MIIIKASIIIILLFVFYKLILGQETYYKSNRIFLLFGLLAAFALPYISLPELLHDQGLLEDQIKNLLVFNSPSVDSELSISDERNAQVLLPDEGESSVSSTISWKSWIILLYFFGVILLSINLIAQVISILWKVFRNKDRMTEGNYIVVNGTSISEPHSFFHFIFINKDKYDQKTYQQIIDHEKIHVDQLHCLDLLLSELAVILLWFNPIIWLYRREVEKNLEFETDQTMIKHGNYEVDQYQRSLLEIAVQNKPLLITTYYNQSLLKQRIMRMNAKKSHGFNYWKYFFVLPLLFSILMSFNQPLSLRGQSDNLNVVPVVNNDCQRLLRAVKSSDARLVSNILETVDPNCSYYDDGEPRSALVAAARSGFLDIGQMLINAGADVEYHARGDESPLMAAARHKNLQFVQLLIDQGAEIDKVVKGDGTALINAVRSGDLEIARVLLDNGADPYLNVPGDEYAMYHARAVNNQGMINLMLQYSNQK